MVISETSFSRQSLALDYWFYCSNFQMVAPGAPARGDHGPWSPRDDAGALGATGWAKIRLGKF